MLENPMPRALIARYAEIFDKTDTPAYRPVQDREASAAQH
jgi:hypothetical protein